MRTEKGVIEMNKNTVAVLVFAFLMMFAMVAPALAAPAEKVIFIAKQVGNSVPPPPADDYRKITTPGDTIHTINQLGAGTIKLWIGTTEATGTPTYQGTTNSIIMWNLNLKNDYQGVIKFEMTWTLPEGTFEGNIIGEMYAPLPNVNVLTGLHGVLHGTGIFEGQTLMLQGARPLGQPFTWTGTIIIP